MSRTDTTAVPAGPVIVNHILEHQSIEIDCAPGSPRPGDLIGSVIKGLGLPTREPSYKLFGEWSWDYTDINMEHWARIKPVTRTRLQALFDAGIVRYANN